jgi:hypothetical protein
MVLREEGYVNRYTNNDHLMYCKCERCKAFWMEYRNEVPTAMESAGEA